MENNNPNAAQQSILSCNIQTIQISWLKHKHETVKVVALRTLFAFIERGSFSPPYSFDVDLFNRVMDVALCQGVDKDLLIALKVEFIGKYDDVRYYFIKHVEKVSLVSY